MWTRYRKTRMLPETVAAPALCSTDPANVTVRLARSKIACAVSCQHYPSCNSFNQDCQDDYCSCDIYTHLRMTFAVVPNCQHWNKWLDTGQVRSSGFKLASEVEWLHTGQVRSRRYVIFVHFRDRRGTYTVHPVPAAYLLFIHRNVHLAY